jgi:uncharacterized membrane protein
MNKSIFVSKTFWFAVLTALSGMFPSYAQLLGIHDVSAVANNIVTGITMLLTIWGRFTATQVTTLSGGPSASPGNLTK